jgi:hypothetical protein
MASAINNPEVIQERYDHYYGLDTDVTPAVPFSSPVGFVGSGYVKTDGGAALQLLITRDGSGNVEYVGDSLPGIATNVTGWRIFKMSYTGTDLDSLKYADGVSTFTKIWTNKATYTY